MSKDNTRKGIWLMVIASALFAIQDGFSRHLAGEYSVWQTIMIRYWFYAGFVIMVALRREGGIAPVLRPKRPWLHGLRAFLHLAEILVIVASFTLIGLINTHAIFASVPLMIAALSRPILGERVGLFGWGAIMLGFIGILVILQPGSDVFSPLMVVPLVAAALFALYSVLTRLVTRDEDPFVAFFFSGVFGAAVMTVIGIWFWQPMSWGDWGWTVAYGVTALVSNWVLVRCYSVAEAHSVQPFSYLQLVFVTLIGFSVFNEALPNSTLSGMVIVVLAGLATLMRNATRSNKA